MLHRTLNAAQVQKVTAKCKHTYTVYQAVSN